MASSPAPAPRPLRGLRLALDIALGAVLLVALLVAAALWWLHASRPQLDGTLRLAALQGPVEVVRDSRGIPHITAGNLHDLYFAEGYVMAQDRLWQMDLMRRLGEGRLSQVFGPVALATDRATRRLGLNRVATNEARRLQPAEAAVLDAFAAGVNANIARRRWRLPLEFALLRYRPRPWQPRDTLAMGAYMYRVLSSNYKDKLRREDFTTRLGPALAAQLFPDQSPWDVPPGSPPPAPEQRFGFGPGRGFGPGLGPGFFFGGRGRGRPMTLPPPVTPRISPQRQPGVAEREPLPVFPVASLPRGGAPQGGSNDWVLSGARSFTGKPILANDPHLQFQVPGLWWAVQLTAPGVNVAGVTLPGVPGVVIGHNDHIAWGVTNTRADVQDLFRETLDNKGNVLTPSGWRPLRYWREEIPVRGQAPVELNVAVTPHGPIIARDGGGPLALDWSLYAPGALAQSIQAFLQLDQAGDWRQFEAAVSGFPGPTQNFVYADTAGHIGYQCAGWVPLRPAGDDGSVPVPGATGAYDWRGWIPFSRLPSVTDPADGMLATANARVTPDHDPVVISTDWDAPNRTRRIYQLLGVLHRWNPSGLARVQGDVESEQDWDFARAVVAAARALSAHGAPIPASTREALGILARFNGYMSANSPAPTLAFETRAEFLRQVVAAKVGDAMARQYRWDEAPVFEQWLLATHPAQWLPAAYQPPKDAGRAAQPPDAAASALGWDRLLLDCLTAVVQRDTLSFSALRWGRLETLTIRHPVFSQIPILRNYADLGPVALSGSPLTVKQARNTRLGNRHDLGPSMRFVADLADWDRSTLTLVSGESGNLFSSHYRDEFSDYLRSVALPLWFTPAEVAAHRAHALRLEP